MKKQFQADPKAARSPADAMISRRHLVAETKSEVERVILQVLHYSKTLDKPLLEKMNQVRLEFPAPESVRQPPPPSIAEARERQNEALTKTWAAAQKQGRAHRE